MPRLEDHALDQLTVKDGKLHFMNRTASEEYLNTSEVRIAKKESFFQHTQSTDVTYTFQLNCVPDWAWTDIFQKVRGSESTKIDRDHLYIRCIPANLKGRYETIKDAIAQTNRLYAEHKKLLTEKVTALDVERAQRAKAESERTATVSDQFANLKM